MLIAIECCEHIPYARRSTTTVVIYEHRALVWLDCGDHNALVFDVVPDERFTRGGRRGMQDVIDVLERNGHLSDANNGDLQRHYANDVLPIVKACLPYWGRE